MRGASGERWRDWAAALVAPLAIAAATCALPPSGEFPIVDDWDYRDTVADVFRFRQVCLSDWPAMTLLTQVAWGVAFAKAAGAATYFVLRISTLAALACGCAALFFVAVRLGASRRWAAFAALAFAFSPPTWLFANTFMTDVPGAALLLATAAAGIRCVHRDGSHSGRRGAWLLLAAAAAAAFLCRQTAALPAACLAALCLRRHPALALCWFWLPFGLAACGYYVWLFQVEGVPYFATVPRVDWSLWRQPAAVAERAATLALTGAFHAAPLALAQWGWRRPMQWRGLLAGAAAAGFALWLAPSAPFHDAFGNAGVALDRAAPGFAALAGPTASAAGRNVPVLALLARAVAAVALASAVSDAWAARRKLRALFAHPWRGALGLTAAAFAASLVVGAAAFDRYYLPALAVGLPLWLRTMPTRRRVRAPGLAAWLALGTTAAFSLAATRDYFVRQRALWAAAEGLLARGIPAHDINAGFEFGGTHRWAPVYRSERRSRPYLAALPEAQRSLHLAAFAPFAADRAERTHAAAFAPLPGYETLATQPFRGWLTGSGAAYALRRHGGAKNGESP